jgi:hypothetical protein
MFTRYTLRIVGDSAAWRRRTRLVRSPPADMSCGTASVHGRTTASMTFSLLRRARNLFSFPYDFLLAMIKV